MTEPRSDHTTHDPLLIVAQAAGDLHGSERDDAGRLVADCVDCAELYGDILRIAGAVHDLPAPARSRDFRLSPRDAARLRRGGLRRLSAVLAGPRFSLARPVGAAFASLGLAGLLLASLPGVPLAGSAAAPAPSAAPLTYEPASEPMENDTAGDDGTVEEDRVRNAARATAPIKQAGGGEAGGATGYGSTGDGATGAGGQPQTGTVEPSSVDLAQRSGDATLGILSGSFLIVGLVLFGLRWTAGRLGDG